jgi:methylated-DNA-protein-cysteine methyltransferase related protein
MRDLLKRLRPRVLAVVEAIPEGRVTTYGAIARRLRATPRQVAFILSHFTPEQSAALPWFRVVAANGVISTIKLGETGRRQIALLRAEGVEVTLRYRIIDFDQVFWQPQGQQDPRKAAKKLAPSTRAK